MSDGDDFLARWSRRKRAARGGEPRPDPQPTAAAAETPTGPQPPATEPAASEPPEPLPSLEDLRAGSDLVAFLREGVPAALRGAAMRKMWSLDPAIRDYIGPSEYAWNFNQPGSMPGFGALEPNSSVAEFLSTMSRVMPAQPKEAPAVPQVADPPPQAAADAPGSLASAEPAEPGNQAADTAESDEEPGLAEPSPTPRRPRHGGALPQ
jgi:Protein of unknown function (DUF3306)